MKTSAAQAGTGTASQDHATLNAYLLKSTVAPALGGLLFGFDTAVIAGTTRDLTAIYHLSAWSLGLTVAIALWGTIVGAMFAGLPGDRFGRRDSLRVLALRYVVSARWRGIGTRWYSSALSAGWESAAHRWARCWICGRCTTYAR